jgi:hypothetical protein
MMHVELAPALELTPRHLTPVTSRVTYEQDSLVCNRTPAILYFDISFLIDDNLCYIHDDDTALHSLLTVRVAAYAWNDVHVQY